MDFRLPGQGVMSNSDERRWQQECCTFRRGWTGEAGMSGGRGGSLGPPDGLPSMEACIEEADGDAAFIAKALGDIARAKGMAQVACDAGLSRESLYKALSGDRNPTLETVLKVIGALGLKLRAEAAPDSAAAGKGAPGT